MAALHKPSIMDKPRTSNLKSGHTGTSSAPIKDDKEVASSHLSKTSPNNPQPRLAMAKFTLKLVTKFHS